jgi:hypothetical protein
MTDLHIWSAVAASLNLVNAMDEAEFSKPSDESDLDEPWPQPQVGQQNEPVWEWAPPDLSAGGAWHAEQVRNL